MLANELRRGVMMMVLWSEVTVVMLWYVVARGSGESDGGTSKC